MNYSPLRYPGGKKRLAAFIANICIENDINGHYVEPFCGGASVALFLLIEGYVQNITINDKDRSIYAFWYSVLNYTEQLCSMIENVDLTIQEWKKQKKIQVDKNTEDLLKLGFSTFYLNRTNRSGIINAGIMGGIDQSGNYLMDCRFNKTDLINRIKRIALYKNQINLYKEDAINLIEIISNKNNDRNIIFYFDPPYYLKANTLYMNHYNDDDHRKLSNKIKAIRNIRWIVSYDNTQEIRTLYNDCFAKEFSIKHTAYETRQGKEILFLSPNIDQPNIIDWNPVNFRLKKNISGNIITYINSV